jgi:hypothetical protein
MPRRGPPPEPQARPTMQLVYRRTWRCCSQQAQAAGVKHTRPTELGSSPGDSRFSHGSPLHTKPTELGSSPGDSRFFHGSPSHTKRKWLHMGLVGWRGVGCTRLTGPLGVTTNVLNIGLCSSCIQGHACSKEKAASMHSLQPRRLTWVPHIDALLMHSRLQHARAATTPVADSTQCARACDPGILCMRQFLCPSALAEHAGFRV